MVWAFVFFLISFNSYSSDQNCLEGLSLPSVESDILKLKSAFNQLTLSDEELLKAPCKTKEPPSYSNLMEYFSNFSGKQKEEIHGVEFKNESKVLLEAFRKLTTNVGKTVPEGLLIQQVRVQESFNINPDCSNVVCAVEKIWGLELGLKLLYMMVKHGFNGSELAIPDSKQYEIHEIDDVLMALNDLPSEMIPLASSNQKLVLSPKSLKINGLDIFALSSIELFDLWKGESHARKQYIIFHELSHNIAYKKNDADQKKAWLQLSGWKLNDDEWEHDSKGCFISMYGTTNPYEDMAETITNYRYNGAELKKKCPKKYAYIQNKIFKKREFLSDNSCQK